MDKEQFTSLLEAGHLLPIYCAHVHHRTQAFEHSETWNCFSFTIGMWSNEEKTGKKKMKESSICKTQVWAIYWFVFQSIIAVKASWICVVSSDLKMFIQLSRWVHLRSKIFTMIMIKMLNVFYIKGSLQQMTLYTESPKRPHPKWLE